MPELIRSIPDDAAYYFQIGLNFADGHGLTFDGRNPTNGFQPLWQAAIAALQSALPFRQHPENFVRAVLLAQAVILTAALLVFHRTMRLLDIPLLRGLGTLLFLTVVYLPMQNGMESALLVLLAATAVYAHGRNPDVALWSGWGCIGFGVLLGGIVLARLDSIFWIAGLLAVLVLKTTNGADESQGRRLRKGFWIGLAFSAVLIPYLVGNYRAYGHFMPISGALKSSFPSVGYHASEIRLQPHEWALLVLLVILSTACLLWEFGPWPSNPAAPLRGPVCALAIGALLHVGYAVFYMKWAVSGWIFVLERFAVCLLVPYLCARAAVYASTVLQRWAIGAVCVVLVATVSAPFTKLAATIMAPLEAMERVMKGRDSPRDLKSDLPSGWTVTSYQAAQWAKANLPPNAVIGMKDAGTMGFFSGRPVVNLDGLVNSFAYQDALKDGQFRAFLRNSGVNYFVQHAFWRQPEVNDGTYTEYVFRSYSHLYDCPGGDLRLWRSEEVFRSPQYYDGPYKTVLVIWKIRPGDLED